MQSKQAVHCGQVLYLPFAELADSAVSQISQISAEYIPYSLLEVDRLLYGQYVKLLISRHKIKNTVGMPTKCFTQLG